jgi:hypothetical protein
MWLQNFFKSLISTSTRRRPTRRSSPASRLCLERLEDRRLPSFVAAVSYPVGTDPQAILTADFNGDTRLDIAVVNNDSNTVSVLLGNGNGTFQTLVNSTTGAGPRSLAVGDFNADGKLDLATANLGNVSILLGNGNGTFQTPTNIDIGSDPASVAVGDFNGDGKLDLGVTSNVYYPPTYGYYSTSPGFFAGRANVLLGNGGGSLSAPNITSLWTGYYFGYHTSAAAADFNGDGIDDFATVNFEHGIAVVLLGASDGTLGAPWNTFSVGPVPYAVAAADVNGDGKIDLVTAKLYGDTVSVLLGNGLGSFGAAQNYLGGSEPRSVAMADFNGDAKIDLVTANQDTGTISVLLGAGAFQPPVNAAAGSNPLAVVVGDFNGDNRPDVASANSSSYSVSVLINDGTWLALDAPSIGINDVTVTEGNSGATAATFTVSLSAPSSQTVSVHYGTADHWSAAAGSDYQATSGDVIFAPGQTSMSVSVLVNGDRLAESTESFLLVLTDPTNAFVADAKGVGAIVEDEPFISIEPNVSALEGSTGTTVLAFTVTISAVYDAPVSVDYATADLTPYQAYYYGPAATAGVDYTAASGTLTIPAGQVTGTITVLPIADGVTEPDEYFFVNLSNPTFARLDSYHSQALATIVDGEPYASIGGGATVVEGNSGTKNVSFTVTLSVASGLPVSVTYATADGAATASSDYQAVSDTLVIPAGQTTGTITVLVNGDRLAEPNESFFVTLSNATNAAIADGQGVGTILDDEPRISISDASGMEGNSGQTPFTFTVSLSAAYDVPVTVAWATADGSATAGSDYLAAFDTLTFAAGETTRTISVAVLGDETFEPSETFRVNLTSAGGALITRAAGFGTIVNDDSNLPQISISDVSRTEGRRGNSFFTFTVTLSAPSAGQVKVNYATADGTARTSDGDYEGATGTLTFAPGETSKTITIKVKGDNKKEANETFYLDLFDLSSNALFSKNRGLGTILNDD